jgi:hypothetical protein
LRSLDGGATWTQGTKEKIIDLGAGPEQSSLQSKDGGKTFATAFSPAG